jgi:type IV pilus assembly protein PilA
VANARVVIRHITAIHQAETQYYAQFGHYAKSLAELGPASANLPKALAEGKNGGYVFAVSEIPDGYVVNANPETFGTSGRRTFYSDQTLTVHNNWGAAPANAASPEINSASPEIK